MDDVDLTDADLTDAASARLLPVWFVAALGAVTVWGAVAGFSGVLFLMTGGYQPLIIGAIATIASAAATVTIVRAVGPRPRADHASALAAVAIALAFFAFAGAFHSEHLLAERDPATYLANGRVIARTHRLHPPIANGAFGPKSLGKSDHYQPNFFPMLPVLLAMGWSALGELGMFLVPPFLGAVGLLACYALASRVLGSRGALLAPAFLALTPLQLWFARDAYSELVVQVVALGGLWLFLEAQARARPGVAFVGGAVVASAALARIDALAIVVGALLMVAAAWVGADSGSRPIEARRVVAAFGGALLGTTAIALAMAAATAGSYISDIGTEFFQLVAALLLAIAFVVAVVVVHGRRPGLGRRVLLSREVFVAGVLVASAAFAWAYWLRPDPQRALRVFSTAKSITPFLRKVWTNWHDSWSLHWFSAYFGLTGIVGAFAGLVILAARARRGDRAAAAVFLVVVPVAVAYIVKPSITPDLPWAMRRYLTVVIPGIAIGAAVLIEKLWRLARSLPESVARLAAMAAVGVVALAVAVPSAQAAIPFAHARAQHGAQAAVHGICRAAGSDAAVLVYGPGPLVIELPAAVWAFCGVPTAASKPIAIPVLARNWKALGKRLLVATGAPDLVRRQVANAVVVGHFVVSDDDAPERVFEKRSRKFAPVPAEIWLLEIPVRG